MQCLPLRTNVSASFVLSSGDANSFASYLPENQTQEAYHEHPDSESQYARRYSGYGVGEDHSRGVAELLVMERE